MSDKPKRRWYQFSLMRMQVGITLVAVALGCVVAIIPVWRSLKDPLDFGEHSEFYRLNGQAARRRLGDAWPKAVNPRDVTLMSYKKESARDSYSSWTQIRLTPAAAQEWANDVHLYQERDAKGSQNQLEGVRRTMGYLPQHRQTGSTPSWWHPTASEVRATEIMLWYDYGSGTARATYTSFDPSTNTLWVYGYACQHDKLWDYGKMPAGVSIR